MRSRLPEVVLFLVALVWGGTFLATRVAMEDTGPFAFLAVRFLIGAALVGAFVRRRPSRNEMKAGVLIGLTLLIAYALQTIGLRHTTSARSAFITSLYVPLVPLLQYPFTGVRASRAAWWGAGLAFVGLAFLSMEGDLSLQFGLGEWLTLGAAVASAVQIVLIGRFAGSGDSTRLTAIQLGFVGLASVALLPLDGPFAFTTRALVIAVGMGVVATAGALWAMNWAQRSVAPSRATLIYATEPVWAAMIGLIAGERIGSTAGIGAALIVGGILVSEFGPARGPRRKAVPEPC